MRVENGLWPYQSRRGGLPLGRRIHLIHSRGRMSPAVNDMPPITMSLRAARWMPP